MNWREHTLLALAVVGFVVPNTMIALFVVRHGLTLDGYFRHWGESLPATQLALDLSIAFVAFALWAALEGRHLGMRSCGSRSQPRCWLGCASLCRSSCCCASARFADDRRREVGSSAKQWAAKDSNLQP